MCCSDLGPWRYKLFFPFEHAFLREKNRISVFASITPLTGITFTIGTAQGIGTTSHLL